MSSDRGVVVARSLRLVVIMLLGCLAVTAVLSLVTLLHLSVTPVAFAGFVACGALAGCAVVIMITEGVRHGRAG